MESKGGGYRVGCNQSLYGEWVTTGGERGGYATAKGSQGQGKGQGGKQAGCLSLHCPQHFGSLDWQAG